MGSGNAAESLGDLPMPKSMNECSGMALKGKIPMSTTEPKAEKDQAAFEPRITEDRTSGGVIILIPNRAPRGWPAMVPRKDDEPDKKR